MNRHQTNQFRTLDIVARLERSTPYGLDGHEVLADAAREIRELREQIASLHKETQ